MNCLFKPRGVGKSELSELVGGYDLQSRPPHPPHPPSPTRGEGGLRLLTFGIICSNKQNCIVIDICDPVVAVGR